MKKQGPPEPLSEEHFANLKRKKGLPVDDPPPEAPSQKKRRTSKKSGHPSKSRISANAKGASAGSIKNQVHGTKTLLVSSNKSNSRVKKTTQSVSESDEETRDEFSASDLEDGDDIDIATDKSGSQKLGDDFLGSDSSVYDSDQEEAKREKFVFSDDEDEDEEEREDKLTAANIEGLSRKLDQQLEEQAAENEAELRQDAIQTNIDGDKPRILDGDNEDEELSSKTKSLLAPDLQMLRTRITEAIRVLENFSTLAEDGRSRAEYTSQLMKDFCACMFFNLAPFREEPGLPCPLTAVL